MAYFRVNDKCNGCLACIQNCPATALSYEDRDQRRTLRHNMALCARCGQCWRVCPQEAIEFQYFLKGPWEDVATLDLVRCCVCGEPLYTANFKQTVSDRGRGEIEPFCPLHRQEVDHLAKAHFYPGRSDGERY
jgi:ferredoxin